MRLEPSIGSSPTNALPNLNNYYPGLDLDWISPLKKVFYANKNKEHQIIVVSHYCFVRSLQIYIAIAYNHLSLKFSIAFLLLYAYVIRLPVESSRWREKKLVWIFLHETSLIGANFRMQKGKVGPRQIEDDCAHTRASPPSHGLQMCSHRTAFFYLSLAW